MWTFLWTIVKRIVGDRWVCATDAAVQIVRAWRTNDNRNTQEQKQIQGRYTNTNKRSPTVQTVPVTAWHTNSQTILEIQIEISIQIQIQLTASHHLVQNTKETRLKRKMQTKDKREPNFLTILLKKKDPWLFRLKSRILPKFDKNR